MNLYALDIPDSPAELSPWLERQLAGLHIAELVAELSAIHGSNAGRGRTLDEVLGWQLPRVLEVGLGEVPQSALRELLKQPRLLVDLQERIFIEGGSYWDRLSQRADDVRHHVDAGWSRVSTMVGEGDASAERSATLRLADFERDRTPVATRSRWRSWAVTITAAAASLVIGIFAGDRLRPTPPQVASGWGWSRPGALAPVGSQAEYLNRLADSAEEWFKKRPDSPAALSKRLSEFRDGCSTLLLADHPPLAADTKSWLREKCRAWAGKLDTHRADVEAGQDVATILTASDETIRKLVHALRTKATEVVG